MGKAHTNNKVAKDLRRMFIASGVMVSGLVGFMFLSPLSSQFTEEGVGRGDSWETEVMELLSTKDYAQALNVVDSIIESKQEGLPRFAYFDRFLSEKERMEVANARADIYDLQWKRIELLKEMGSQALLIEALEDYSAVIGYNQGRAKVLLNSLGGE